MQLSKKKHLFIKPKSDEKNSFILQSRPIRRLINKIKKNKKVKTIVRKRKIFNAATSIDSQLQDSLSTLLDHTDNQATKPSYEVLESNLTKLLDFHTDSQKNAPNYPVLIDNLSTRLDAYAAIQKTERAYQVLIKDIASILDNYTKTQKTDPVYTVLKNNLSILLDFYEDTQKTDQLYKEAILVEDPKKAARNKLAYRFFYNKLAGKLQTYQLIDTDRGENLAFSSNLATKVVATALNLVYVIPIPIIPAVIAGAGQVALKITSDKRKIAKTKNKLDHCIPENNFIKLLSSLLTKIHEPDFKNQENIDLFLAPIFQNFWSLFKNQAKENPKRENLNEFWSGCLVEYFKRLKCPLRQENFYEKVVAMAEKNWPKANPGEPTNSPSPTTASIAPVVNHWGTNLQQQLLILYCIQLLLIQLYRQALAQQKRLNSFHETKDETKLSLLGFFADSKLATRATKPCVPLNSIPQGAGVYTART